MIDLSYLKGKTLAVFGLARSGMATVEALLAGGATVLAWDDNEANRIKAEEQGATLRELSTIDWTDVSSLVLSPGVPLTHPEPHPVALAAQNAGVEVIGDIELLARADPNTPIIGVTGTNGKSTTTALVAHILEEAGKRVQVGGNLGTPVLSFDRLGGKGVYVLELSSYQLDLMHETPIHTAIFLNIAPDHLDRHGDLDGYIKAKKRIFNGIVEGGTALIGLDDETCQGLWQELGQQRYYKVIPFSGRFPAHGGIYAMNGMLVDDTNHRRQTLADLKMIISLTGTHNHQNAAASFGATLSVGVKPATIIAAMKTFPGLAHRQEVVSIVDGVTYINDSKATNAEATARALSSYDNIYWIAGGLAKEGGISTLNGELNSVRHAYLIGEAATDFAKTLHDKIDHTIAGDLETALNLAQKEAISAEGNSVVLLSPACASFDQYPNFEARGDAFKALVSSLPGKRGGIQ
ncbi:MAG: UDP-N-acetylmuramoyl-L-alanine--D-glutamate ligase [Alphaproteobacteria bacterium]|nr:UDP-N-acetylmuramoyl-L-alanine--D-glutamate ligase [Alphaproteobacteria bacterium]